MAPRHDDPLRPELKEAKEALAGALEEACNSDVESADTGELIRVEEMLSIASEAAKKAISIRRRLGRDRRDLTEAPAGAARDPVGGAPARDAPAPDDVETHRWFTDSTGAQWDVFAVHPSEEMAGRARLPERYRAGWLAFESASGKRRLAPIPDGWQSLPPENLQRLCDDAESVRQRSPAPEARTDAREWNDRGE